MSMLSEWTQLDEPWEVDEGFSRVVCGSTCVFRTLLASCMENGQENKQRARGEARVAGQARHRRASHGAGANSSSASATWLPCRVGQLPACLWRSPLITRGKYFLMWFLEGIRVHKGLYKPGPCAYLSYNMIHIERRRTPAKLEKSLSCPM